MSYDDYDRNVCQLALVFSFAFNANEVKVLGPESKMLTLSTLIVHLLLSLSASIRLRNFEAEQQN